MAISLDINNLSPTEIDRMRNDYKNFGGLIFNEETLYNPLAHIPLELQDNPHVYYTFLLSQPEYLHFICDQFLNVQLMPFQCVILQELWQRKFPMLVASRGAGKSFILAVYALLRGLLLPGRKIVVAGASFRQSKLIAEYCSQIWNNAPLLRNSLYGHSGGFSHNQGYKGGNDSVYFFVGDSKITFIPVGCLHPDSIITTNTGIKTIKSLKNNFDKVYGDTKYRDIGFFYDSGISPSYNVVTSCGYKYTGTPNHKMKVVRNQKIEWVRTDELKIGDKILIDRSERWFDPKFTCFKDEAYCLGLLLGDGNYTHKDRLRHTTIDKEIIESLNKTIGEFKPESDGLHYNLCGRQKRLDWLNFWKLESKKSYQKILPDTILSSSKENVAACLSGLFDSDGHIVVDENKGGLASSINLTTTSKILAEQVQYILLHFGIISSLRFRDRKSPRSGKDAKRCYELGIYGKNVKIFYEQIGFRLSRKQKLLEYVIENKKRWVTNGDYIPVDISNCKYVTNRKVLTFDKYYKHKKYFNEYFKEYIELFNEDYFYDEIVEVTKSIDQQMYDINVPEGNIYCANGFYSHNTGETIRGLRANDIICDEFKSLNREIFENVIAGFAAVEGSPKQKVAIGLEQEFNEIFNIDEKVKRDPLDISNQIVISGTAYYYFNHFAEYWEKWKSIVESKGDQDRIDEIFPEGIPEGFNWKDYSVIRLPYDILPKRYMDAGNIARSKATLHKGLFDMEFGAVFSRDSDGFFKASLLQSCVADMNNQIEKDGEVITYKPLLCGDPNKKYYMGVDTASQVDNFAIVLLEVCGSYRKIVYSWTTNTKEFKKGKKEGRIQETDFFQYCSRKIRDLMTRFQIVRISIDSQGGGRTIYESLHDRNKLKSGEQMLWEIIEPDKKKDTDAEEGLHIIEMVNFRKLDYTSSANHNLKKDFEDKNCLFPEYNPAILASYANIEAEYFREMEDCIEDIEELKLELATITVTTSATGSERFDTPEVKLEGDKKGRARKDRYSALIMANMAARTDYHEAHNYDRRSLGQIANASLNKSDVDFIGPAWLTKSLNGIYD